MVITYKKVCGPLTSSKYPNAYDKDELVRKAVAELGLKESRAKAMTKEELCRALGKEYIGKTKPKPKPKPKPNKKEEPTTESKAKMCSMRRSIPRYTKKELEDLAKARGLPQKDWKGRSYEDLCKLLRVKSDATIHLAKTPTVVKYSAGCVERSRKPLKDYQEGVVKYMGKHRGLIVFHKVGSGKTLTAVTVSQCYLDKYPDHKVVVIAPAGLLNNFKDEMKQSYGRLNHADKYEFYSFQGFTAAAKRKEIDCGKSLLIIDEAHNLRTPPGKNGKKPKGVNTGHVLECAEKAHKVLLLTGTPLYNYVSDIRTLYDMIREPGAEPVAGRSYTNSYVFQKLRCKISYFDPGRSEKFPTRKVHHVSIPMTKTYQKKYQNILEDILGGESGYAKSIFGDKDLESFHNAVRRAVNNLDNSEANAKTTWVVDKIRETPAKEKIIVFSNFLDAGMKLITDRLPKDIPYAIIRGDVPMKQRKQIVKEYNEDKIKVLFISKAGGEGLDLKGTRHIILMEPGWNQASADQVIGRGIRYESHDHLPASERNVTVHNLYHVLPEDTAPAVHGEIKEYLSKFKKNPEMDPKEAGKIPLDPYANSVDFFLGTYTKRKEIVLKYFIDKIKNLSIEKCYK